METADKAGSSDMVRELLEDLRAATRRGRIRGLRSCMLAERVGGWHAQLKKAGSESADLAQRVGVRGGRGGRGVFESVWESATTQDHVGREQRAAWRAEAAGEGRRAPNREGT